MLKTNSKEVKNAIREYLRKQVFAELEEREIETNKPYGAYMEIIETEKFYEKYKSNFDMFKDWLQGLGGFGADIYYTSSKRNHPGGKVQDLLQDWLQETDAEVRKYSTSESEEIATRLCWREFQYLLSKEKEA